MDLRQSAADVAKAVLPAGVHRWLRSAVNGSLGAPAKHRVDFGDLRRVAPISRLYGYDRGEPVDRYYIEKFLRAHRRQITGTVLEISENTYTRTFGDGGVTHSDVLHYDDPSPPATVTGDLTDAPHLLSNHYDCVIITQTLQLIYDLRGAIETLHRIVKPGGVVLATAPGLTQIADHPWNDTWHWSFTRASLRRLFEEGFPGGQVDVEAFGNVLASIAFLHGLAQDELNEGELDASDPEYQMLIAVAARKAPAGNGS